MVLQIFFLYFFKNKERWIHSIVTVTLKSRCIQKGSGKYDLWGRLLELKCFQGSTLAEFHSTNAIFGHVYLEIKDIIFLTRKVMFYVRCTERRTESSENVLTLGIAEDSFFSMCVVIIVVEKVITFFDVSECTNFNISRKLQSSSAYCRH